jgi:hypothetical protein
LYFLVETTILVFDSFAIRSWSYTAFVLPSRALSTRSLSTVRKCH